MTSIAQTPEDALRTWFPSTPGFRDRQRDALERIWNGRSILLLMPTGVGKSIVYQLPVLAGGGIGVIISPLIALMQQQAQILSDLGAITLSLSGRDAKDAQEALRDFPWSREPAFLFVSPERVETDGYLEHLLRKNKRFITLVAVDEAHCISQWGHDFRPPYKAIPNFLDRAFGNSSWPPVVCLTATLNRNSQAEILADFRLDSSDVIRSHSMLRTNLDLSFRIIESNEEKLQALENVLDQYRGQKIIVYTHLKQNKKWGTRALSAHFLQRGIRCAPFDADLAMTDKDKTLEDFSIGSVDVVFATGAFGMGVDISDIRGVIHFLIPESLEQYYQEVGRAGRDGAPAFGILLYTRTNAKVRRDLIRVAGRSREQVWDVWNNDVANGKASLRSISPWLSFQSKDAEYAIFYAFQRVGALNIVARGPGRLNSFEPRGPGGTEFLLRLNAATRIGNVTAAIRKLGLNPSDTMDQLFSLYDKGEIKLVRSPDKTLLFTTRELRDQEVEDLVKVISEMVDERLRGFDGFVALIEAGTDPSAALDAWFGAN